jgi:hypothetical protein
MWAALIPIIAKYGLDVAEKIWSKWAYGKDPVQSDWDELKAMTNQMSKDRVLAALARAGIDPASDQGKALLDLAS